MIRPVLVIARRDIVATVFTRGFLIWLLMPLLAIGIGLFASLLAAGGEQASARPIAVVDAAGSLKPWLERVIDEAETRAAYAALRERHRRLHPDKPLPPELAAMPEDLNRSRLADLADPAVFELLSRAAGMDLERPRRPSWIPKFVFVAPAADRDAQVERLLRTDGEGGDAQRFDALLLIEDERMRLILARQGSPDIDAINGLVNDAREMRAVESRKLGKQLAAVREVRQPIAVERDGTRAERRGADGARTAMAQATAAVLFMLIGLLAGVLLSNMVEEKANKVIEVLVASVPVPAIFAGKLLAMLAVSLIGVTLWTAIIGGGAAMALAHAPAGVLPEPATGWPTMLTLALVYLVTAYLIYGAIYLGIGSLCASIREVQSLSLPVTIVQAMVLLGVMRALGEPDGLWPGIMSWFPLSSPYMLAARAAIEPGLGVHVGAILWQVAFAGIVIWLAARLFRYGVLNSGPPPRLLSLRRQKSSLS